MNIEPVIYNEDEELPLNAEGKLDITSIVFTPDNSGLASARQWSVGKYAHLTRDSAEAFCLGWNAYIDTHIQ